MPSVRPGSARRLNSSTPFGMGRSRIPALSAGQSRGGGAVLSPPVRAWWAPRRPSLARESSSSASTLWSGMVSASQAKLAGSTLAITTGLAAPKVPRVFRAARLMISALEPVAPTSRTISSLSPSPSLSKSCICPPPPGTPIRQSAAGLPDVARRGPTWQFTGPASEIGQPAVLICWRTAGSSAATVSSLVGRLRSRGSLWVSPTAVYQRYRRHLVVADDSTTRPPSPSSQASGRFMRPSPWEARISMVPISSPVGFSNWVVR